MPIVAVAHTIHNQTPEKTTLGNCTVLQGLPMAQAAALHGLSPRFVSFKGTMQTLNTFSQNILFFSEETLPTLYKQLLKAVAAHRVGTRPGRSEPRAVKRRPKVYPRLTVPRAQAA